MIIIGVCDDSERDSKTIVNFIEEYMKERKSLYMIFICTTGEELLASNQNFDIVFLDIAMGSGINGIVTGKKLRSMNRKIKIIYTTSFVQYCNQAINSVHAFAYLEKPIQKEKFMKQLEDILDFVEEENTKKQVVTFEIIEITSGYKIDTIIKKILVDEIYYFEYVNRKIKIKTHNDEFYFMGQMKKLMEKMREYTFESCHQSYLVNLKYIKKIKGYDLYLENGKKIPVSQKKSCEFRKKLNKFIQKNIEER